MNYQTTFSVTKDEFTQVVSAEGTMNSRGTVSYVIELYHEKLDERKIVKTTDKLIAEERVRRICSQWSDKWSQLAEKNSTEEKFRVLQKINDNRINKYQNLLKKSLHREFISIWSRLEKHDLFIKKKPDQPSFIEFKSYPPERKRTEYSFTFFEKIFKSLKQKVIDYYEAEYQRSVADWEQMKLEIDRTNDEIKIKNELIKQEYFLALEQYNKEKKEFEDRQEEYNSQISEKEQKYKACDEEIVSFYFSEVLKQYIDLEYESLGFVLEYVNNTKMLIVEWNLPDVSEVSDIKEYKLLTSKNEIKEIKYKKEDFNNFYENTLYNILLTIMFLVYKLDYANTISSININGWVAGINPASGKMNNKCIASICITKEMFLDLELENIDLKACFKGLKGIAAPKLSSLTPIRPVLRISKEDSRFVDSYSVVNDLDENVNLAAMDWEDFEHLIRELFEKYFLKKGGEVKITQASRDGGVDAIAFDPDPITGGKTVIQAKRYTNTVGVSAVRDLFGTVHNEGANRGILVTTSDFGADSHEFVSNKPISLINGSELLGLLEEYGYHAKIDIAEAKRIQINS